MSKRRGNSEGTITQRTDGRWEARVSLPGGKRKSFYGKTRQEVHEKLKKAQRDADAGLLALDERQTVEQYLNSWLDIVRNQIKPSSWRRYSDIVKLHLLPDLGKVVLTKLTPQQVQAFYAKKIKSGLSPTTVQQQHVVLHRALKDALMLGIIQRNVTDMVRSPRRAEFEHITLTESQVRSFLVAIAGDRFEALYVLALTTGMREGELLGLRWKDVDLEKGKLQVRMSVQRDDNKFVLGEPKTSHSRRLITLSRRAVYVLRLHRIRQNEERLLLGEEWDKTYDLVFPNTWGKIMKPSYLSQELFQRLLVKAGLPRIRFHDLRHTAATLLLAKGVNPKIVSEMLGHSNITITLNIYSHVTPDMQALAAEMMDLVVGDE